MSLSRLLSAMSQNFRSTTRLFTDRTTLSILKTKGLMYSTLGGSTCHRLGSQFVLRSSNIKYVICKNNIFNGLRHTQRRMFGKTRKRHTDLEFINGKRHIRLLGKPILFTIMFTASTFAGCLIWKFEVLQEVVQRLMKGEKPQNIAEQTSHQAILAGIIGINFAVFLWWRMAKSPKDITIMTKLFTGTLFSKNRCSSMFLSTFSHQEFWHIFLNMYVLWSFRRRITFMEKEEFVAFYLTAGVVASLASYVRLALSPFTAALGASRSLGASGAILAVVAAVISQNPDTRMQIALIGDIIPHSFEGRHALLFLIALDTIGILRGWKVFDHACHLGGVLFGLWYANYGRKYLWKDPEATVMRFWHKIRHGSRKEK